MSDERLIKKMRLVNENFRSLTASSIAQAAEALRAFGEFAFKATTAEDHAHAADILMMRAKAAWNPLKAAEFRRLAKQEYAWAQEKRAATEETV